ncbi:MAG: mechanosensitive ion channel [Phycisphaeraceae bacterium]|nr:mechanosensitive ion channel [Phycisphaeraceae bacterium]
MSISLNLPLLAETASDATGLAPERLWHLIETYAVPAITVLVIGLAALVLGAWARRAVHRACTRAHLDETLGRFFGTVARWAVLLLAALFCLGKFGIETAGFAVVLGSIGLAIGLALQGTLSHFASGVMLLIFRPFKIGDVVVVGGQLGKIAEIELFTTALDTFDNRRVILPNGQVFGSVIENITHHPIRRVDVAVGTDYGADLDAARQALTEAVQTVEGGLEDPEPKVVLLEMADSSINWSVRLWCNKDDFGSVKEALIRAVKKSLDEAGIAIPFPQMDVHLDPAVSEAA